MKNLFYQRFSEILTEKNISKRALARALGVSAMSISDWSNGKVQPTAENILSIAEYFSISTDYLLGKSNDFIDDIKPKITNNGGLFEDRREMLELYDRLDDEKKGSILSILRGLTESKKK